MRLVLLLMLPLGACLGREPPVVAEVEPAAGPVAAATPIIVAWPAGHDCRGLAAAVLALPEEQRERLDPDRSPFAVEASRPFVADIPVRDAVGAPCLLEIGLVTKLDSVPAEPVQHTIVRSEYRSGTRTARNPRRDELDDAEDELEGSGSSRRMVSTGDLTLDLIGLFGKAVLGGIERADRWRTARALVDAREETPATEETARWMPYTYELTVLEADRLAAVEVALSDAGGSPSVARALIREEQRLEVAKGRHRSDRALLEGEGGVSGTAADLALWRAKTPNLRVSRLLQAVLDGEMAELPEHPGAHMAAARGVTAQTGDDGVWRLRLPGEISDAPEPAAGP